MRQGFGWRWAAMAAALLLGAQSASAAPPAHEPDFQPPKLAGAKPWTGPAIDDGPGKFSFAVVTDLYSGYRKGVFEVAASRAWPVAPGLHHDDRRPDRGRHRGQGEAQRRVGRVRRPAVGAARALFPRRRQPRPDQPGPAAGVRGALWRRYYHFLYKDVLFLVLDTEDYSDAADGRRSSSCATTTSAPTKTDPCQGRDAALRRPDGGQGGRDRRCPERLFREGR